PQTNGPRGRGISGIVPRRYGRRVPRVWYIVIYVPNVDPPGRRSGSAPGRDLPDRPGAGIRDGRVRDHARARRNRRRRAPRLRRGLARGTPPLGFWTGGGAVRARGGRLATHAPDRHRIRGRGPAPPPSRPDRRGDC